jgi:4-hydroxy-tetrahydrodipicolinate reductase
MRIIINGAGGRMGNALRAMTEKKGAQVAAMVDPFVQEPGMLQKLSQFDGQADCIIDFSNHAGTHELLSYALEKGLPVILCTTGHTRQELDEIEEAAKQIPVFHSGNMSLGIAVLTRLVKDAAKMFPDADIEIVESHHNQKLDVPSGTALMLARSVQAVREDATLLVGRHENGKRTKQEVGIHSLRMGNTVGIHEVIINTGTQILTLKHEAQDRALFAEGALSAARFLVGKAPGLYSMEDLV